MYFLNKERLSPGAHRHSHQPVLRRELILYMVVLICVFYFFCAIRNLLNFCFEDIFPMECQSNLLLPHRLKDFLVRFPITIIRPSEWISNKQILRNTGWEREIMNSAMKSAFRYHRRVWNYFAFWISMRSVSFFVVFWALWCGTYWIRA